uniref:Uncharacterized protein n=1 Tax=Anguilla anguilla TaxID=7936 RepID=A0A0E9TYT8_ANGAN
MYFISLKPFQAGAGCSICCPVHGMFHRQRTGLKYLLV